VLPVAIQQSRKQTLWLIIADHQRVVRGPQETFCHRVVEKAHEVLPIPVDIKQPHRLAVQIELGPGQDLA
jgi:hypothetical protein